MNGFAYGMVNMQSYIVREHQSLAEIELSDEENARMLD